MNGDGEIYGIPRTTIQRDDGFIIRQDRCDNVGFKIPEDNLFTVDQFRDLMLRFTNDDPNKNGKNTYGWASPSDEKDNMGPLMGYAFGDLGWQKAPEGGGQPEPDRLRHPHFPVHFQDYHGRFSGELLGSDAGRLVQGRRGRVCSADERTDQETAGRIKSFRNGRAIDKTPVSVYLIS